MSNFSYVPQVLKVKKVEDIPKEILKLQVKEGGKIPIISIHQDNVSNEWIVFYYPLKNRVGGAM